MLCAKCSTPVPDESKFCLSCGADLSDPAAEHATSLTDDGVSNMERKLRADTEGDFEIERELGRGGMAVVYLATDIHLRRKVAIKVLPPDLTFGKGTIERFRREAQTAAQLDHPNIIPVYRISTGGDLFWYAMKFIEGRSLDEILKEGMRFDLSGCIEVLDQVAAALDWAHRRQVVHRDVKPANIMVDPMGRVTMADFGIAKALSKTSLTASGSAIGTPNYMSPEQCMGSEITGAADQYALGVVTYQMLSGKLPFEADSAVELIQKHCFVPPPSLEEARPGLPPNVYSAVERSLAKKAGERFPSIGEFVRALEDPARALVAAGSRPSVTPVPAEAPTATPIPIDEQSTTPMPPVQIDEASTTPLPAAAPSATPAPPPPTQPPGWDGAPTEVISTARKRRGVGVAVLAIAALIVVAGGVGWLVVGGGSEEPTPPAVASGDSGSEGEVLQSETLALGTEAEGGSEPTAAGAQESMETPHVQLRDETGDPAAAEPTGQRRETTPPTQPPQQDQRTEQATDAAPVVVQQREPPPVQPEPNRVEEPEAPPAPGTVLWSGSSGYRGYGAPAIGGNGRIYVGSRMFDQAGSRIGTLRVSGTVGSAPALGPDGTVYVGVGERLHAYASNGSEKWDFNLRAPLVGAPAVGEDGRIYVGADSGLFVIQPDGQMSFGVILNAPVVTSPAIGQYGTVYIGASDGIHAIAADRRERWARSVRSGRMSSPAIGADGTVYVLSGLGHLYAIDRQGGEKWVTVVTLPSRTGQLSSPVIGQDGTVYVGTTDGNLFAIDPASGTPRWSKEVEGGVSSSPAVASDGTIHAASAAGYLVAFNPDGSTWWHLELGVSLRSPTIGPLGTVYVVSTDGTLYAVRGTSRGLANSPWPRAGHDNANSGFVGRRD